MPRFTAIGGGLDPSLRDKLNTYLLLNNGSPAGYVPVWGRVRPGSDPDHTSPMSLQSLSANTVVASAHLPSLQS